VSQPNSEVTHKTTAVVTRGVGHAREPLVFEHACTGLQLPAGTVEAGESFEATAIRELAEEAGLTDVSLHGELGYLDEIPRGQPVPSSPLPLRTQGRGARALAVPM
jgi:8-oxo-dGTP pyrophosphatase MutT (NUDIX family)